MPRCAPLPRTSRTRPSLGTPAANRVHHCLRPANVKTFNVLGIWFRRTLPILLRTRSPSLPIITPDEHCGHRCRWHPVTVKNVIPTISKHLANADGTYNYEPSFSVGDTVYYTLETTVPYYTGYSTKRVFKINDTASSAISFDCR